MNGSDQLALGELVGPHGLRGVVKLQLYNRDSTALTVGMTVTLRRPEPDAPAMLYTVRSVERLVHKSQARLALAGVCDRDAAEALRGAVLSVARAELAPLADDEFYLADAIGLPVERTREDGETQTLGVITSLTTNGPQDLYEVEWRSASGARHTWLLPVLPHFLEHVGAERVRVNLPVGMLPDALERGDAT